MLTAKLINTNKKAGEKGIYQIYGTEQRESAIGTSLISVKKLVAPYVTEESLQEQIAVLQEKINAIKNLEGVPK